MGLLGIERINNNNIDYKLIYNWCSKKHVYEWFEQRILSQKEIENKYSNKLIKQSQELFYIVFSKKRIGLAQIYESDFRGEKVNEFDLFIGEEDYLDKKIGREVLAIILEYIYSKNNNKTILRPFKRNKRACNCYKRAGFKWLEDYMGKDTLNNPETISVYLWKVDD